MNPILVTSTEAATGKTAVSLALAQRAQAADLNVGYMKPKGTRLQSATGKTRDEDPMLARELLDLDAEMHELEPIVYTPTFVEEAIRGRENSDELRTRLLDSYEALAADRDLMILEGTDRLTTGGIVDLTDPEIAEEIDARVVLLTRYDEPGDVDDVLAAADQIGDDLAGVLFNAVPDTVFDQLTSDVVPFLENHGVPVLGVVPRIKELAGTTVGELADRLGAQLLTTDAATDVFIERLTVGAMSGESALTHFRRTQDAAMITGGDRSDIITAALEASGIKCVVLGGGFRPPGAVLGKAEERGIPVLLVQSDTRNVIERTEAALQSGPTRDPATVDRMADLLTERTDIEALLSE